ncbi:hypothetical protein [Massilia phyllosphaerae]|uniref:hypothetical protein n=1 Tax=Massilia phyllosphaerae TaxID=3106034 RepID=UPI002B1CC280|nr:hypothetical protein [Massilia sp. SGZ-792]
MLDGVSDVFKFFQASKLASAALLITAMCMIFGPRYAFIVPPVPSDWRWLPWSVMFFTGLQCAYWTSTAILTRLHKGAHALRDVLFPVRLDQLSNDEQFVLVVATDNAGHFFREGAERYSPRPQSVAINLAEASLIKKGLMADSFAGSYLTEKGERFCVSNKLYARINHTRNLPPLS